MTSQQKLQIVIDAKDNASVSLKWLKKEMQGVTKDVKDSSKEMQETNKRTSSSFAWLWSVIAGAFAVWTIMTFWKWVFKTAQEIDSLNRKSNIVLWEFKAGVEETAKSVASSMWMTRNEFVLATTNLSDLLIPMQFTREEAVTMSEEVVWLAWALSEWSDWQYTASETADILAKAMLWEREQLKSFNIAISEADVSQRLLEKGQKDLTGTMLQQAKAVATQELIFEKSTDAQNAFKENGDSLARTQAELKAKFWDVKNDLAESFMPTILELVEMFGDSATAVLENEELMEDLKTAIKFVWEAIIRAIKKIKDIAYWIKWLWEQIWYAIIDIQNWYESVKESTQWVVQSLKDRRQSFKDFFFWMVDSVKGKFDWMIAGVRNAIATAQDAFAAIGIWSWSWSNGKRAIWWPVTTNTPYLVWENWPEMFVPSSSWSIVSNNNIWWWVNITFWDIVGGTRSDAEYIAKVVEQKVISAYKKNLAWIR